MGRTAILALAVALLGLAVFSSLALAGSPAAVVPSPETGRALPPQVWTTAAEPIEIGDAELEGAVNPRGAPTRYHFQYGRTKSYGLATNVSEIPGGNERRKVRATIFELRPGGLVYHFRLVASNPEGTTYGADKTFRSIKSRPKPRALIACYLDRARRYTALRHPRRCTLRGYQRKQLVTIQIKGMRWGHWGVHAPRAAYGVNLRNGERVRVVAFRRITCPDGSAWYSRVNGLFYSQLRTFELRLPTCVPAAQPRSRRSSAEPRPRTP